jgi:hypothetical protein
MPTAHSCRTCALYDLDAVKDRAGRVRKNRVAKCRWETRMIAASVRRSCGYYLSGSPGRTIRGGYMPPNEGKDCPCWEERSPVV